MRIDWSDTTIRLTGAGHTRWPGGAADPGRNWARWVFDHDLWLVDAGRGAMRLREGWVELERGEALWLRPGWEYAAEQDPDDPLGMYFCHFDLLDAEGVVIPPAGFSLPPERLGKVDMAFAEGVMKRTVAAARGERWGGSSFPGEGRDRATSLMRGLLIELDAATAATQTRPDAGHGDARRIQRMAHRLAQDPASAPSVEELASELSLSRAHFSRLFKRVVGRTPQQFLLMWRVRQAQRMLMESDASMSEIAERVGYRDVHFFSRQFKQVTGLSPLRFRKEVRATREAADAGNAFS